MRRTNTASQEKGDPCLIRLETEQCPTDDPLGFSTAVNHAIQECFRAGGGKVVLPAGTYRSACIELASGVMLEVPSGTILRAAPDFFAPDPRISSSPTSMPDIKRAFIKAIDCQNAGIIGEGTIDGDNPSTLFYEDPYFPLFFHRCEDVHVSGLTIHNEIYWVQIYLQCKDVEISHLQIDGYVSSLNNGIDLVSCRDAWIHHIKCDTDGDAVCLQTADGIPCENVRIEDCLLSSHCDAIKFGTQTQGDFRNICIRRCRIVPSRITDYCYYGYLTGVSGLSFQMNEGASLDNILVEDVEIEGTQAPVFLLLWNRLNPQEKPHGRFGSLTLRRVNVRTDGLIGSSAHGHAEAPIGPLIFEDCHFLQLPPAPVRRGNHEDATLEQPLPYLDGTMFGPLPGDGFFFRNVSNLDTRGLVLESMNNE